MSVAAVEATIVVVVVEVTGVEQTVAVPPQMVHQEVTQTYR